MTSQPTLTRKSLTFIKDETDFYPHQVLGVRDLARRTSFILADEMGLGKTLQALTVAAIDFEQGWARRVLIVTPASLKDNWAEEIEQFTNFDAVVLTGGPKTRSKRIREFNRQDSHHVLIVNYEQVKPHLQELNACNFDIVMYDEAHYIKSPKSQRSKAAHGLHGKRHFLITGSPLLNHVNDLWSLLYRCDPGSFPNYWRFLNRYAVFGGYKDKQIVGVKNESELTEILQSYMLRRLKADVLDLPDKQYVQIKVDLSPAQWKLYKQANEEMQLTIPGDPTPMEIENALVRFTRLKQICATTAAIEGYDDDSAKLDRVVEDIIELSENGHKVVVWTQFRSVLRALRNRLDAHNTGVHNIVIPHFSLHGDVAQDKRVPMVREWSAVDGPAAMCSMLQVGGVGLNMAAARHVLFVDKLFVPMLNEQGVDRVHRIGASTTQPVQIREYIARGTIEARIETILRTKKKVFGTVVDTTDFKRRLIQALQEEDDE